MPHSQILELRPAPPSARFLSIPPNFKPLGHSTDTILLLSPVLLESQATIAITHLKPFLTAFTEAAAAKEADMQAKINFFQAAEAKLA